MNTPITLSNDHQVLAQLALHYKAHYCQPYGGQFNREEFLHWIDIALPRFPEERQPTQETAMKRRFAQQPPAETRVRVTDIGGRHAAKLGVVMGPYPNPATLHSHCKVQLDDGQIIGIAWLAGLEPMDDHVTEDA